MRNKMEKQIIMLKGNNAREFANGMLDKESARYKIVDDKMITDMADKDAWDPRYKKALREVFVSIIDLFLVNDYDVIIINSPIDFYESVLNVAEINEAKIIKKEV